MENNQYKYNDKPLVPYMPERPIPGSCYTPYQIDPEYYEVEEGYTKGTLFPELYRPYPGKIIGKEVY